MKIIYDADSLMWRFGFAFEAKTSENPFSQVDVEGCERALKGHLSSIKRRLNATDMVLVFSSPRCFRYDLFPGYKGNRRQARPSLYSGMQRYLKDNWHWECWDRLEADDTTALLAWNKPNTIMVSCDKDLLTVPGLHYNPSKGIDEPIRLITPFDGMVNHMYQTVMGDVVDNIPGCKGVGPKSPYVDQLLTSETPEELWCNTLTPFLEKGFSEDEVLLSARLTYILCQPDDYREGKIRLWRPTDLLWGKQC